MAIKSKLDLLSLNEDERRKAEGKFLVSLSLIEEDELRGIVDLLKAKGIEITKAREIKVLANSREEIVKKFSILGEINELGLYVQDPSRINKNVIDIYKKISYCIQTGKPYKKEDGTYEPFLFSEAEWQNEFNKESLELISDANDELEDTLVTEEPSQEQIADEEPNFSEPETIDTTHIDIQEYMSSQAPETMNFAALEDSVAKMHSELDSITNQTSNLADHITSLSKYKDSIAMELKDEFIGFGDIDLETYGTGEAA